MVTIRLTREESLSAGHPPAPRQAPELPLGLDPAQIRRHAKDDDDIALNALINAVADAKVAGQDIRSRYTAIHGDVTKTELANAVAVRQMADKRVEVIAAKLDRARTIAVSAVEYLEAELRGPSKPKTTGESMMHAEIRSALAAMKSSERETTIKAAIESQDQRTISAVLNAPAFLSGLSDLEMTTHRNKWQRARYPQQLDRLDRLRAALDDFDKVSASLLRWSHNLVDPRVTAEAERLAEAARKAASAA